MDGLDNLCKVFEKCWKVIVDRYRLRRKEFAFFSESDVHHALASSLESENLSHVHLEFPISLEPSDLWAQVEKFGKVSFGKGYYRADMCILHEEKPRLISEIRWMPALIPPFQFLDGHFRREQVQSATEKLAKKRERYDKGIPNWYSKKLLRNLEKFLDVLRRYEKDYQLDGYLCLIDELCPSIDKQLSEKIKIFSAPDNFHLCVNYVE